MASAYRKRGRWYLRYKDRYGRWVAQASTARTKSEAKRDAYDIERREERYRLGLEVAPYEAPTLGEALVWWLETFCRGKPSYAKSKNVIDLHLVTSGLAGKRLDKVTPGDVEELLHEKSRAIGTKGKPLGPQSLNHLRGFLRRVFAAAMKKRMITGANPIDEVGRWKVAKVEHDYLRPEEVLPVLRALAPQHRSLFATAVYAGLRKGELFGLRGTDVDLAARTITVRRSYDRDTTKGGHADTIPIATELVPYLEAAIAESRSELVFPGPGGKMRSENAQVELTLRRALRRAGICQGYDHKCRAKGCGRVERHTDDQPRRCPDHGHRMWPVGIVRPIRFHDLRHTTGSLLAMRGVDTPALQRILRHRDPRLTMSTYVHLTPDYLRAEIDRLAFGPATPADVSAETREAVAGGVATRLLPDALPTATPDAETPGDPQGFRAFPGERDIGFEPTTFSLGS